MQHVVVPPNASPALDKSKSNKARKPRKRWVGPQVEKMEHLFKVNQNPKSEDLDQLSNELGVCIIYLSLRPIVAL